MFNTPLLNPYITSSRNYTTTTDQTVKPPTDTCITNKKKRTCSRPSPPTHTLTLTHSFPFPMPTVHLLPPPGYQSCTPAPSDARQCGDFCHPPAPPSW